MSEQGLLETFGKESDTRFVINDISHGLLRTPGLRLLWPAQTDLLSPSIAPWTSIPSVHHTHAHGHKWISEATAEVAVYACKRILAHISANTNHVQSMSAHLTMMIVLLVHFPIGQAAEHTSKLPAIINSVNLTPLGRNC